MRTLAVFSLLATAAAATPHLSWFEPAAHDRFVARTPGFRATVGPRGVSFRGGLEFRFLGAKGSRPETFGAATLSRISWDRSDRLTTTVVQVARYRGVYPGVDLQYRFDRGQLEYDLLLSPGADLSAVRLRANGRISVLPDGNARIERGGETVIQRPPRAWSAADPGREIRVGYVACGSDLCFFAEWDRAGGLVIDPTVTYGSYFGGGSSDTVSAATTDAQGNLYVAGSTQSSDFPFTKPSMIQNMAPAYGYSFYLAKFSPAGQLIYCAQITFGSSISRIAVDPRGAVYLVMYANSREYLPEPAWLQQNASYLLLKINAAGNDLTYRTYLPASPDALLPDGAGNLFLSLYVTDSRLTVKDTPGAFRSSGSGRQIVKLSSAGTLVLAATHLEYDSDFVGSMAWDNDGNLVVAGSGGNVPRTDGALQQYNNGILAYRSADAAASWTPANDFQPGLITYDRGVPGRLFGISGSKFFMSADFGRTWSEQSTFPANTTTYRIVTVADNPDLVFVTGSPILRSTDAGVTWTPLKNVANYSGSFWADPRNPSTLVNLAFGGLQVSKDGGESWTTVRTQLRSPGATLAATEADPNCLVILDASYGLYAFALDTQIVTLLAQRSDLTSIAPDPADPARLLFTTTGPASGQAILASEDGGKTLTKLGAYPASSAALGTSLIADPTQRNTFYLTTVPPQRTTDGSQTWTPLPPLPVSTSFSLYINPLNSAEILAIKGVGGDALIAKFSADLTTRYWSTFLGGNGNESAAAVAVAPDNSIVIGGSTDSSDLGSRYGSASDVRRGVTDIFLARISADGSACLNFRILGGSATDSMSSLRLDAAGNVLLGGISYAADFPTTANALLRQPPRKTPTQGRFAAILAPDFSSLFSTYLGGNGSDSFLGPFPAIEGQVWLTGSATSTDLPTPGAAASALPIGYEDLYLMRLDWRP